MKVFEVGFNNLQPKGERTGIDTLKEGKFFHLILHR